ncbi:MAG: PIN domain-containing protein [Dehalococcoidales bacterium]|nr:PIN domain-containing protein [Dehalococcoidales bacterium]
MTALVFIDTNIFLDFYEVDSGDATLPLLKYINKNHSKIITTSEVEMEFKKNRQRVILESLSYIKLKKAELISIPAFLRESTLDRNIKKTQKDLNFQSAALVGRALSILRDPLSDRVYRTLQRLFTSRADCHLTRHKAIRRNIQTLATKRFELGYPPRKVSDHSLIDAINWEWIIHCAQHSTHDIVIVSRDRDYGEHYSGDSIINDWLLQEFGERVGRTRSISLTTSLSKALTQASIIVSKAEQEAEESLIKARTSWDSLILKQFPTFDPTWPDDTKLKWFQAFDILLKQNFSKLT